MTLTDRFEADLQRLSELGANLSNAMHREIHGKEKFDKLITERLGQDKAENYISSLPNFREKYDSWYSEALSLVKQIIPDRLKNFISMYEKQPNRKAIEFGNYTIQDFLMGLSVTHPYSGKEKVGPSAAAPQFAQQLAIVEAARARFKTSLFDIRQLVQSEMFDTELESARALAKAKYHRAAGVICGVLLEKHLGQVALSRGLKITKKHPSISDWNELLKTNDVLSVPQWRHISLMADYRNVCGHAKSQEPKPEQINDLLDGTEKIIRSIF